MFHVEHSGERQVPNTGDVARALGEVGVVLPDVDVDRLVRHAASVLAANTVLNLTRILEPTDVLWLQIVDSLAYLPLVGELEGPLVDIGSGGGYPGIPLAIATGLDVTLCDATGKKARFLAAVAEEIVPRASVYGGRAEDLARERPVEFRTAVARAVASSAALVELAAPLLQVGGRLLALKGALGTTELSDGDRAAALCGMHRTGLWRYELPHRGERRCVVAYERVAGTTVKLPRRPGQAQQRPLGS